MNMNALPTFLTTKVPGSNCQKPVLFAQPLKKLSLFLNQIVIGKRMFKIQIINNNKNPRQHYEENIESVQ